MEISGYLDVFIFVVETIIDNDWSCVSWATGNSLTVTTKIVNAIL
jgi:hypothetical protein